MTNDFFFKMLRINQCNLWLEGEKATVRCKGY